MADLLMSNRKSGFLMTFTQNLRGTLEMGWKVKSSNVVTVLYIILITEHIVQRRKLELCNLRELRDQPGSAANCFI